MIDAKRQLLAHALKDPDNQHFVLLFESCVPLHNFVSCPDPERSTRGNRRVLLSGSQFLRLHPRTRKAYDILTRLKDNSLPKVQNIKYIKIFKENSIAFRLKYRYPPA